MSSQSRMRESAAPPTPQGQGRGRFFRHPEPETARFRIWPVFLTFQGCPGRCVFCAQHLQSGSPPAPLERVLAVMTESLEAAGRQGRGPYELAFYGGVFTALPDPWPWRFLEAAARLRAMGLVTRVRCSTRPDACAPPLLERLRAGGLDFVELGAQTFDDAVLAAAGRGHDAAATRRAACDVRNAGRLHPCLVIDGTPLAALFRGGRYAPWDLDATLEALSRALPVLWRGGARVSRIGLCPEPAFQAAVLAGPVHPALGARARARALLGIVAAEARALGGRAAGLVAPRRFAGEFFGHAGELVPAYAALGLDKANVHFEARSDFFLAGREV